MRHANLGYSELKYNFPSPVSLCGRPKDREHLKFTLGELVFIIYTGLEEYIVTAW